MKFACYGHGNIRSTHAKTLEITKEKQVTIRGDCIIGIASDFDSAFLNQSIKGKKKLLLHLSCGGATDTVSADINQSFSSHDEIVIRKSGFLSCRTLGIHADKAASDLSADLVKLLNIPGKKIDVKIGFF
ncbi:MAG: DUF371 domain-containing protein [archaeon]